MVTERQIATEISATCHTCVNKLISEGVEPLRAIDLVWDAHYNIIAAHVRIAMLLGDKRETLKETDQR
jgi:hypothetical protein